MNNLRLVGGVLLICAVMVAGGFCAGKRSVKPEVVERVTQGDTKVVDRVVIKIVTVKPDGTRTETTKVEDRSEEKKTSSTVVDTKAPMPQTNWSLGLTYRPDRDVLLSPYSPDRFGVDMGRRVLGPVWVNMSYTWSRDLLVGVRYEW